MVVYLRKRNKEELIPACILFLLCFLGLSQMQGIGILNLFLTAAIIGACALVRVDTLFVLMYACLPFYNLMSYRMGTYSLHYLVIGLFCVKYLASHPVSPKKLICFLVLFLLRVFAADLVLLVSWSVLILPLILTYGEEIWTRNARRLLCYFSLSMVLSSIIGYVMMLRGSTIYTNAYVYINGMRMTRFAGVSGDSIIYGESTLLVIAANLVCALKRAGGRKWHIACAVVLSFFCLLTFSKLAAAGLLLCYAVYFFFRLKQGAKSRKSFLARLLLLLLLLALLIGGMVALLLNSGNYILLGYLERFTRENLSTGRNAVWSHYLGIMTSNLRYVLFPMTNALYETPFFNPATSSFIWHAHNLYLETICVFGWVGGLSALAWLAWRILQFIRSRKPAPLLLPLLVLLFVGIGAHGNLEYQFYLQLAFALSLLHSPVSVFINGSEKNAHQTSVPPAENPADSPRF